MSAPNKSLKDVCYDVLRKYKIVRRVDLRVMKILYDVRDKRISCLEAEEKIQDYQKELNSIGHESLESILTRSFKKLLANEK